MQTLWLLVAAAASLTASVSCFPAPGRTEHIHYDQQQNGNSNYRVSLNKILVAILPLSEALAIGEAAGDSFGDNFSTDLTVLDLKPPPIPEDDDEEKPMLTLDELLESTSTDKAPMTTDKPVVSTSAVAVTPASENEKEPTKVEDKKKPSSIEQRHNKPTASTVCNPDGEGRCTRTKRRPEFRLSSILMPLLKQLQHQE